VNLLDNQSQHDVAVDLNVGVVERSRVDPLIIDKPDSVRASCSMNPTTPVTPSSDDSIECLLLLDDFANGGTVHVANGRAYMKAESVHFSSLEDVNVRVSVAAALIKKAFLPIPTDEAKTIEEAVGGFVKWPKRLVEIEIAKESRGPVVTQALKVGGDSEPSPEDDKKISYKLINPKFRLLAQHANRIMLPKGDSINVKVCASIAVVPIPVTFEDVREFLRYEEIGASCITVYMG